MTERTGRGVWMTNPDFDLGWRACWGSPGLCSRATGSLHRALTPTEVPPCRALWSSSWQSGLRGLATHPEPQLRELAGNANERAPPSQSESRGRGPGSFYNPLSVCGVSFCPWSLLWSPQDLRGLRDFRQVKRPLRASVFCSRNKEEGVGGLSELIYLRSLEQCMGHSKGCVRASRSLINSSILNLEPWMAIKDFKRVGPFPDALEHVRCHLSWESGGGVPPIAVLTSNNSRETEMGYRRAEQGGFIRFGGAFQRTEHQEGLWP